MTGPTGPTGRQAPRVSTGIWKFATSTTIADPGSTYFRMNSATSSSVTEIAFDDVSISGSAETAAVLFGANGSTYKGIIRLESVSNPDNWRDYFVTAVPAVVGFYQFTVLAGSVSSPFTLWSADDQVYASFAYTGDKGSTGATGPTGSAGSASGSTTQVQFNDAGSFAGDAGLTYNKTTDVLTMGGAVVGSLTGLIKGSSGTLSAATAGTDYYNPGGTDVAVADGGTGGSTASAARTNLGLAIGTDVQAYSAPLADLAGGTWAPNSSTTSSFLSFEEATNNGSNYVAVTVPTALTGNRLQTLPDVDGNIVVDAATQTLTNKTLTTPTISSTGFANATHAHTAANSGGVLTPDALAIVYCGLSADYTASNVNTAQKIFNASTNGAVTLPGNTTYVFEMVLQIQTTGTTSHNISLLFGGTATLTSIRYDGTTSNSASDTTNTTGVTRRSWNAATANQLFTAAVASASYTHILVKGEVRINAGGTFIPQFQWSAAPGGTSTVRQDSYILMVPVGSGSVTTLGTWS